MGEHGGTQRDSVQWEKGDCGVCCMPFSLKQWVRHARHSRPLTGLFPCLFVTTPTRDHFRLGSLSHPTAFYLWIISWHIIQSKTWGCTGSLIVLITFLSTAFQAPPPPFHVPWQHIFLCQVRWYCKLDACTWNIESFLKTVIALKKMWMWQYVLSHVQLQLWVMKCKIYCTYKWWPTKGMKQVPFITPTSEINPCTITHKPIQYIKEEYCHSYSVHQQSTSNCGEYLWSSKCKICPLQS